jgi:HPt (histidine-containing phosphotransfer) domain-containing protein
LQTENTSIIELTNLWSIIGEGEVEIMTNFICSFFDGAEKRLASMREAVAEANCYELELEAHTLKSSGGNFGAEKLSRLCQQLEDMAHEGILQESGNRLNQIEIEYQRVKTALEEVIKDNQQHL